MPSSIRTTGSREHWLDVVKCTGLLFIVLSHAGLTVPGTSFFYVPVFFLTAGYVFRRIPFPVFIFRKIRRLYLPFVIANILSLFLHNLLYLTGIYRTFYSPEELLRRSAQVFLFRTGDFLCAPSWFLLTLFLGNILFYLLHTIAALFPERKKEVLGGICIVIAVLGLITLDLLRTVTWCDNAIPAGLLLSLPFFYLGWLIREYDAVNRFFGSVVPEIRRLRWLLFAASVLILAWGINFGYRCNYRSASFSAKWFFYPAAVFGCYAVIFLVREIFENIGRIFLFLSGLSEGLIPVLLMHPFAFQIVTIIQVHLFHVPVAELPAWPHLKTSLPASLAAFVLGVALPWLGFRVYRRIFSGKRDLSFR